MFMLKIIHKSASSSSSSSTVEPSYLTLQAIKHVQDGDPTLQENEWYKEAVNTDLTNYCPWQLSDFDEAALNDLRQPGKTRHDIVREFCKTDGYRRRYLYPLANELLYFL